MEEIYIRTSRDTTAGVEFINKQTWDEEHTQPAGFTYMRTENSRPVTYVPKEGMDAAIATLPYDERQLAVLAILIDKLDQMCRSPKSATWVQEDKSSIVDIFDLYNADKEIEVAYQLQQEFQGILNTYMRQDELAGPTVVIRISYDDTTNVELDNGYGCGYKNFLPKDKPTGFTITDNGVATHYTVPEFLRDSLLYNLHGDQRELVYTALAIKKIKALKPGTKVADVIISSNASQWRSDRHTLDGWRGKRGFDAEPYPGPVDAGELLRFLEHRLKAYTVSEEV